MSGLLDAIASRKLQAADPADFIQDSNYLIVQMEEGALANHAERKSAALTE